ncbi:MAG: C-terminal binding protein [Spirochaetaceae bacterium]|nr:C-terminal binding protein [Spirochaetaceae bacterium]
MAIRKAKAAGVAKPLAVITDDRFGDADIERGVLESAGVELRVADCRSSADVAAAGGRADALLVNMARVDAQAIESLERCRVIARYGVGMDNIDLEAARRRGIVVANVPGYCDREVAEHALALILALARGIGRRDAGVRAGRWNLGPPGRRIAGTVLGVLGFGGTAKTLIRAALGMGFREILAWSPHLTAEKLRVTLGAAPDALGVVARAASFEEIFSSSDWISVHLPLKPETRGLVGAVQLAAMKADAALVNVSRGPVVDEEALIEALSSGRLGGAGLDVFTAEPLPTGSRLRSLPNVVLTDHSAYASRESLAELRVRTAENALRILADCGLASIPGR